jgi:SAM-dependent methyltransferase
MPDVEDLAQMYGDEYAQFLSLEETHSGGDGTRKVVEYLSEQPKAVFFDFGCGGGSLLRSVQGLGWKCYGLDFERSELEKVSAALDIDIYSKLGDLPSDIMFDVVHMGDVIEHMTNLNEDMPCVIKRLKHGGVLIAQGPLDASFNLFLVGLRLNKILNRSDSDVAPYHVSLATIKGQRSLFKRMGLEELQFDVFETSHPAPERLTKNVMKSLRLISLYTLRSASKLISHGFSGKMGNRYFYIGRKVDQ